MAYVGESGYQTQDRVGVGRARAMRFEVAPGSWLAPLHRGHGRTIKDGARKVRGRALYFAPLFTTAVRSIIASLHAFSAIEPENSMFKRTLALAAGLALSVSAVIANAADVLRVSAIPDEAPTELLRKFKPLGAYLEKELGMKVEFVPVADYPAVVEALATDRLDMAWLGGFTFVQVNLRTNGNAVPLVQREQDAQFTSKFITSDANVKSVQDLKGKTFAFGSVSSTSGSLMPRYFMLQDGIKPEDFFSRVAYSGAHDATAAWVQAGKVDAGVLNASVWQKLVDSGKVDTNKVKVFATTPTYFDYNWTVRGTLDPQLAEKIKKAFLALDPSKPEDKAILDLQAASRFIETDPSNYKGIEEAARAADLLK